MFLRGSLQILKFENTEIDLELMIRTFYQSPEVLNAQKNHLVTNRETIPTDTLFDNLWHIKNVGQTGGTIDADIDGTEAWDVTTGGVTTHNDTIVVCIIEGGGADLTHVDLIDNRWINYAEIPSDGIDNDNNGYVDDYFGWNVFSNNDDVDFGGHGTSVEGMIGAVGNDNIGVVGVNWRVKMMTIRGSSADEATVISAYAYALSHRKKYNDTNGEEGAFVVATNSSFGLNFGQPENAPLWCSF